MQHTDSLPISMIKGMTMAKTRAIMVVAAMTLVVVVIFNRHVLPAFYFLPYHPL